MIGAETYKKEAATLTEPERFSGSRRIAWRCPSNIALIKYWGKMADQVPRNPSLSFTLRNAFTETGIDYARATGKKPEVRFFFDGEENEAFGCRVAEYLVSLQLYLPFLSAFDLIIHSKNTFPHSSGIASSASSMGALALCLAGMEQDLFGTLEGDEDFFRKASFLARLGSGSAARSVYGGFVVWGTTPRWPGSSDYFAVPVEVDESNLFWDLQDAILITSKDKKTISSSAGHAMMTGHPFAGARYAQARNNLVSLSGAIAGADEKSFIRILEQEALSLHALMISADPGYTLLNEDTWAIIRKIRDFRQNTGTFVTFTLDAGPNVHFIYLKKDAEPVLDFIRKDLLPHCQEGYWIPDEIGKGPVRLNQKEEVGAW